MHILGKKREAIKGEWIHGDEVSSNSAKKVPRGFGKELENPIRKGSRHEQGGGWTGGKGRTSGTAMKTEGGRPTYPKEFEKSSWQRGELKQRPKGVWGGVCLGGGFRREKGGKKIRVPGRSSAEGLNTEEALSRRRTSKDWKKTRLKKRSVDSRHAWGRDLKGGITVERRR